MHKQVLINVEATDIRVAMLEDGQLVELFVEKFNGKAILGNIYKGRVEAIVPGLKAVFVNVGMEKNAFLHFDDVLEEYELPDRGKPERLHPSRVAPPPQPINAEDDDYIEPQDLGEGAKAKEEEDDPELEMARPKAHPLKVGDTLLVQVTKETLGEKGPRVTSYLSVPGRYLVLMPFSANHGGVSRKIQDMDERRRLRDVLKSIQPKHGSFIIRTAGLEEDEAAIREDAQALQKTWREIIRKNMRMQAPAVVYDEGEILLRLVRDSLRNDVNEILVDSKEEMRNLIKVCEAMAPRLLPMIHIFQSPRNIFEVFEVEKQFQKALRRKVWLKSGGAIVIDETEALTAIDVNSGKYVGKEDQEEVILKTNLEACRGISRQLRLRDLGGLVVIDFIDMKSRENQQAVLRELRNCLRQDNAKYSMTDISEFGLVELTRKRVRKSLSHAIYRPCPYCQGTGKILEEAETWKLIKYSLLEELNKGDNVESVEIVVHSQMRTYLEKEVIEDIKGIVRRHKIKLNFVGRPDFHHEQFSLIKQVGPAIKPEAPKETRQKRLPGEKFQEKPLENWQNATG